MPGKAGNQLTQMQRHKIWIHLESNWEDLKRYTQSELAAMMKKEFGHHVTKQNISSIIRTAQLKQDQNLGIPQFNRETAEAMARLVCILTDTIDQEYQLLQDPSLLEDLNIVKEFAGFPSEAEESTTEEPVEEELPNCANCGQVFTPSVEDDLYCSDQCEQEAMAKETTEE